MSFSQGQIELLMQNYAKEEFFCALSPDEKILYEELLKQQEIWHFPAVSPSVGQFLLFLTTLISPRSIFEFGSGYGHSAFWYLLSKSQELSHVYLTEKRTDLEEVFHSLPWPNSWRGKLHYHQGDAFKTLDHLQETFDLVLVDGMKAQYQDFLIKIHSRLSHSGLAIVDNAFWKGHFLDPLQKEKKSSKAIGNLHLWLKEQTLYHCSFLPVGDGLFLLKKKQ